MDFQKEPELSITTLVVVEPKGLILVMLSLQPLEDLAGALYARVKPSASQPFPKLFTWRWAIQ